MISSLLWLRFLVVCLLLVGQHVIAWSASRRFGVTRREAVGIAGLVLLGPSSAAAYTRDSDMLRESLYLMSRVQEATIQQERFVSRSETQEALKQKMKLTLRLVEKNYLLLDQINFSSNFVQPQDDIITAVQAGNEAVESLQTAIDYVNNDLKVGALTNDQRDYLTSNLTNCREKLFVFLKYMPQDKLLQARERVEYENVKNREEYAGSSDDGLFNAVKLPWK
jgi:hypothetical protein